MADVVAGPVAGVGTSDEIPGVTFSTIPSSHDLRGGFAKPYTRPSSSDEVIREVFWSHSAPRVLRGMHVQGPAMASAKNVFLTSGAVFDVVLDLRRSSPTYGQYRAYILDPSVLLHIPPGCAHGFQALEQAQMVYLCDVAYNPASDHGIRYDSLGIPWPLPGPAVSDRDLGLPVWREYDSPFE